MYPNHTITKNHMHEQFFFFYKLHEHVEKVSFEIPTATNHKLDDLNLNKYT